MRQEQVLKTEWQFESLSHPGKLFKVKMTGDVNYIERAYSLSCNCPAWIFKSGSERDCKHCRNVRAQLGVRDNLDLIRN